MKESKMFKAGLGRACGAAVLAGALAMPSVGFAAAGFPDDDVPPGAWYVPHIQAAIDAGIVRGYPDGTFRPDQGVTRAQVAEMLCRVEGDALAEGQIAQENKTPWSDNPAGMWYTHAMNWAYENGVFTGDGSGTSTVRPDDGITREEMAKVVASYMAKFRGATVDVEGLDWPGGAQATQGIDEVSEWALPYMLWLSNQGVMGGHVNGDGTVSLDPKGAATRAMFSKVAVATSEWTPDAEQKAEAPAKAEAYDITQDGASIRAFDGEGADITAKCEFALGGVWQASGSFSGLSADTGYEVEVRVAAAGDVAASDAVPVSFRTAAEEGQGQQQGPQQTQKAEAPAAIDTVMCDTEKAWFAALDASGEDITDACEFRIDGEWQASPEFSDLEYDTEYVVQARVAAANGLAASDPIALSFRTSEAKYGAVTPKKVEVYDITKNSAKVRTFDREGNDTTSTCQFLTDGGWQSSSELKNLAPGTEYTVGARGVWGDGLQVSKTVEVTFRTLESEMHGDPASVSVKHLGSESAEACVIDTEGTDITRKCEFSIDNRKWYGWEYLRGLAPDTEYTVKARLKAANGQPAGNVIVSTTFRTEPPREGVQVVRAEKPAEIRVMVLSQDIARLAAFDDEGVDITSACEFRLDDGFWEECSKDFPEEKWMAYGMLPGTDHTAYARVKTAYNEDGTVEAYASEPTEIRFTTLYGVAQVEACEVGANSVKLKAIDAHGVDVTDRCVFSVAGPGIPITETYFRKQVEFSGLQPDSEYRIHARMVDGIDLPEGFGVYTASSTVRTTPAEEA